MDKDLHPEMTRVKFLGNKAMAFLISKLTGARYHDVSCGFRGYTRDTLLRLNLFGGFTYTQETFLDLSFKHVHIVEVPLKVRGVREHGKSRVASNLFKYALNTSKIILRSYRDYRPLHVFGTLCLICLVIGVATGGFLLWHYIAIGKFSPHKWAGFVSAAAFFMGWLILVTGLLADMTARLRMNQEHIMYMIRKDLYDNRREQE
jgi:hypothetical protein